jgi:iron(III) transport system ATP-binding protein
MISVRNLHKTFTFEKGRTAALDDVTLEVNQGEFFVLLGPSGSGKTTLLRAIAGLEKPDAGEIVLGGRTLYSSAQGIQLLPEDRGIGMVFQSYAIWPHLSVGENIGLVLTHGKMRLGRSHVEERIRYALNLVQLEDFKDKPARLLSGGQQQRVALARALAVNPKVLLMDEPLSNLDARLREEVRFKIKSLVTSLGITAVYVTHDQVEAMVVADRISVMAGGRVLQVGSPYDLYRSPSSVRVAEFFGSINWLDATMVGERTAETEIGVFQTNGRRLDSDRIVLGIRPEDLQLGAAATAGCNEFSGEVTSRTFAGDQLYVDLKIGARILRAKTMADGLEAGSRVSVHVPGEKLIVFPRQTFDGVRENTD